MKKILTAVFALLFFSFAGIAQTTGQKTTKPGKEVVKTQTGKAVNTKPTKAPLVKTTPVTAKTETIKSKAGPAKTATIPSTPLTPKTQKSTPVLKKDGTPDKRFSANKHLKKDGTPDKRFSEHKKGQ